MNPINLSAEQLEWARSILAKQQLTEVEFGNLFKKTFPGVFPETTAGRGVSVRLKEKLREAGIPYARQPPGPKRVDPPNNRWLTANPELVIQYHPKLAVVSDIHAGNHDADVIEFVAEKLVERGIDTLVWGGDIFDNAYIGHKGSHSAYASPLDEVVFGAAQIWQRFKQAGIVTSYFYQGNHDNKPFRGTQGEWSFENFLQDHFFPQVDLKGSNIITTNRYYITMRPRKPKSFPWKGPENFATRFTHQKEYSRIPLRTASRLASKFFMNVVCNHQHHLGWTWHESGLVWLADSGCTQERGGVEYKDMRDSAHPQHIQGFLTIEEGRPHSWPFMH